MSKEKKADIIITHELLRSWSPCTDGYRKFCELFPDGATLKTAIDGLTDAGRDDWGYWLFCTCRGKNLFPSITDRGYKNSGDRNSGDMNSGNMNSGNMNSGDMNSGNMNSGDMNSGDRNSGYMNSGDRNSGYMNSGDMNSGNMNSGDRNSGDRNSGYMNSGYMNSGDMNSGNRNSGYMNSNDPPFLRVFEKDCKPEVWDDAYKPAFLFFDLTYWVDESDMTDAEKAVDPNFFVRGGQLRKRDYKEAFQLSWNNADKKDRERVRDLPNFDAEIFFKISGIDLRKQS